MTNGQPRDTGNIGHIRRRTNGQPRDTGNIGHIRRRTKTNKTKTQH
jgi:hypothetical protein